MIEIVNFLSLLATGVIQLGVIGAFLLLIFNKKIDWKRLVIFSLINGIADGVTRFAVPQYAQILYLLVYIAVMFITLKIILGFKNTIAIFGFCLSFILSAIVSVVSEMLFKIVFGDNYADLWAQKFLNIIGQNFATLLCLIITLIIAYLKINVNVPENINKKRLLRIIFNAVLISMIVIINIFFFENNLRRIPINVTVFEAATLALLILLNVFNFIRSGELEIKNQELEFQKTYINTLNDLIDGLRGFKHDYNNMVQSIGGYLAMGDLNGLKKYHSQMLSETNMINSIMPLNSYIKDNPPIYGLLLSKLSLSEIKGVIFNINVMCGISDIHIKMYDFCKVIGILLDNAIEAAAESEKKYVEFSVREASDGHAVCIDIINTYSGCVNEERIFLNGFSTKEGHSGFGLWEVRKIISKYRNFEMRTDIAEKLFTQQVKISK